LEAPDAERVGRLVARLQTSGRVALERIACRHLVSALVRHAAAAARVRSLARAAVERTAAAVRCRSAVLSCRTGRNRHADADGAVARSAGRAGPALQLSAAPVRSRPTRLAGRTLRGGHARALSATAIADGARSARSAVDRATATVRRRSADLACRAR